MRTVSWFPNWQISYEMSEDGMTYTFTMKDGLKWSDGEKLWMQMTFCIAGTVWQMKTQLLTILTCAPYLQLRMTALWISKQAEDGKTFTAHLKAPCAYFLDLCAFPAFYPVPQQASRSC